MKTKTNPRQGSTSLNPAMLQQTMYMPETMVVELQKFAKQSKCSVSELVRDFVETGIERNFRKSKVVRIILPDELQTMLKTRSKKSNLTVGQVILADLSKAEDA